MAQKIKWVDNHIEVTPPKRTKKITGTRFATILGLNPWSTDFEIWCAVTKTYEEPFEETIYTAAGKAIEPLQAKYMQEAYLMDNLVTPTDLYGEDYFNKTWGDFFPNEPVLGGMWDYLLYEDNKPSCVLEMKTTKRSEDWADDIPEYYALQAALYAYLLGVDDVIMVASFLGEKDYKNPEKFKPSAENTITVQFKVSLRYPDFAEKVAQVQAWWDKYVVTGISPDFDEKKDADILAALRTNSLSPDTDVKTLIKEAEGLKAEVDKVEATIADKVKRLKEIDALIKEHALKQFRDGDKKVEVKGSIYTWSVSKSESKKVVINEDALKADGLYDKYSQEQVNTTYRMTCK